MELLKLGASIVIDVVGMGSVLLGITEITDIIYAPLSAVLIYALYGEVFFAAVGFIEEALPGTDIVPTATIAWAYSTFVD